MFLRKKYHLGMTGDEVKEALQGGGGNKRITINLPSLKFFTMLSGNSTSFIIPDSEIADIDSETLENVELFVNTEITVSGTPLPVSGLARFAYKFGNIATWSFNFKFPSVGEENIVAVALFTRDTDSETRNELIGNPVLQFSAVFPT